MRDAEAVRETPGNKGAQGAEEILERNITFPAGDSVDQESKARSLRYSWQHP